MSKTEIWLMSDKLTLNAGHVDVTVERTSTGVDFEIDDGASETSTFFGLDADRVVLLASFLGGDFRRKLVARMRQSPGYNGLPWEETEREFDEMTDEELIEFVVRSMEYDGG